MGPLAPLLGGALLALGATRPAAGDVVAPGVEVLFIRHGHACHNAMKYQGAGWGTRKLWQATYLDPPLTDCGLHLSRRNGEALREQLRQHGWEPDLVASSTSLRATQTALAMFPGREIQQLPFFLENGVGRCNNANTVKAQRKSLVALHGEGEARRVRFEGVGRYSSSYEQFRGALGERVWPQIWRQGRWVRVAIVGHSHTLTSFMKTHFRIETGKLLNNEAVLVRYFRGATKGVLEEAPWSKNAFPPIATWTKDYLCKRDYESCDMGLAAIKGPPKGEGRCCAPSA